MKMRWSITFYEAQTKQSDIFSWLCYQNVSKLSFASMRMCDCKRLSVHNFVDFCLQTTPTTSEVLRCRSPSRGPPSSLMPDITQTRCHTVAIHRRWGGSLWATTTIAVEGSTDLFIASLWLEWSSRFSVTLLVFRRADHSTLQVLTPFMWFLSPLLLKACFKSPPAHQTSSDWSTAVTSHTAVNSDAHSIRSLQNIWIRL